MRVTPIDIIKKEFRTARNGFDRQDVESFLKDVRATLEEILNENKSFIGLRHIPPDRNLLV